jgi:rod shape-determining protein MreC
MHDKTIRRRRLVLLGLVVGSLLLLTASFGGSGGGGLGALQRGVATVLSPIQEGASRALKPVRDGVGWVGDTFDAKNENEQLRADLAQARRVKADVGALTGQNAELRRMLGMNERAQIQDMGLVPARVIGRSPNVINQAIRINQGSSDGVRSGQPVVTGSGLVGTVDAVGPNFAIVTLLTDADFGAGAKIAEGGITGIVKPAAGAPRELRMEGPGASDDVRKDDMLVTSGTSDPRFPSPFPPDVLIGRVSEVEDPGSDSQVIRVRPFVDVRDVNFVEVITKMDPARS